MTPRSIGRYDIESVLGAGGIGQVFAARDQQLGRLVAIKSLHAQFVSDPVFVNRFRDEARILAGLSHVNITTLYDLLEENQQIHMVMELVRGRTLDAVLKEATRLSVPECLAIIDQTITGLTYAHDMGVVHRDIKPSNLMLMDSGLLKIMDFGIARVKGSQRLTQTGTMVGTLSYLPPEQIMGGEGDQRGDLYSLACVLFEMLAGDPPFNAKSEYELIRAHVEVPPPKITEHLPNIPLAIEQALIRALAKNPEDRFESVREFGEALGTDSLRGRSIAIIRDQVLTRSRDGTMAPTQVMTVPTRGMTSAEALAPPVPSPAASRPPPPAQSVNRPTPGAAVSQGGGVNGGRASGPGAGTPAGGQKAGKTLALVLSGVAVLLLAGLGSIWWLWSVPGPVAGDRIASAGSANVPARIVDPTPAQPTPVQPTPVQAIPVPAIPVPASPPQQAPAPLVAAPPPVALPLANDKPPAVQTLPGPDIRPAVATQPPIALPPLQPPSGTSPSGSTPSVTSPQAGSPSGTAPSLAGETPAYKGRVADWPGPSMIAVPAAGKFGFQWLKLNGIEEMNTSKADAETTQRALKAFLLSAGSEAVCYARAENTYQCFAGDQDIALWAIKKGFARAAFLAPSAYRDASR